MGASLIDIRSTVTKNLGDRLTETSFVDNAINRTVREVNRMTRLREMEAKGNFETADGQSKYLIASETVTSIDPYAILYVRNNESDQEKPLNRVEYEDYLKIDRTDTNKRGVPTEYTIFGDSLYLFNNVPDSNSSNNYTIELSWHKRAALLSSDADETEFPVEWDEVIEVGATARMFRLLNEPDLYQVNQAEYQRLLSLWQSPRAEEDVTDPTGGFSFEP